MSASQTQRLLDADYRVNGVPAVAYVAPDGTSTPALTVIFHLFTMQQRERPELNPVAFSGGKLIMSERPIFLKVRVTQLAAPAQGGRFTVGTDVYTVGEDPMYATDEDLEWICKCAKN